MGKAADVRSVDALKDAKAALVEFREVINIALAEANAEVQRTIHWLQHDMTLYWRMQMRKRSEKVAQAKSELYRAQLSAMDARAQCVDQKKALEKAQRMLAEAEAKIQAVQRWSRLLDREFMLYRAACQPVARAVDGEIPRGEAKLDIMMDRLQAYLRVAPPRTGEMRTGAAPADDASDNESSAGDEPGKS